MFKFLISLHRAENNAESLSMQAKIQCHSKPLNTKITTTNQLIEHNVAGITNIMNPMAASSGSRIHSVVTKLT